MDTNQSLPCYKCERETDERRGVWREGYFYCDKCYGREIPSSRDNPLPSPPPQVPGMGPDAPLNKDGLQSYIPYDMTQIPPEFLFSLGGLLKQGADKYGEGNWKSLSARTHLNHGLCHILANLAGDNQEDHLTHAAARIIFAWWMDTRGDGHAPM